MSSSVFDFKAINQKCREMSSDIFGQAGDQLMDCPSCDAVFQPDIHDEYDRCHYCEGTHKKKRRDLENDGYLPTAEDLNPVQTTAAPPAPAPKWPGKAPPPNGASGGGLGGQATGQSMPQAVRCPRCGGRLKAKSLGMYCVDCEEFI
jgi:uncharacterized C2H2 Zn-finger protein